MLKWVATNPFAWIGIAAGAVATFIGVVNHFAITAEKLNDQLQELKATEEELISTQDKLTEIDNKIAEIQSKGTLSITDNADISRLQIEKSLLEDEIELLKIKKELQQDEYNKNAKKYADGQYSNYMGGKVGIADVINRYKGYKTKSERTDIDDYFIEDVKRGLKETEAELIEYRNTINENLTSLAPDDEESQKKLETIREAIEKLIYTEEELEKIKFDRFIIDPNNTGISKGFEKIKSDGEVVTQEITDLASKFPTLKKFMDDNGISAETLAAELNNVGTEAENSGGNVDSLSISLSELEKASDNIKTLGSAFKELSEDGYITTKTLGEIQTATGLSGDEWEDYKTKLLNVKAGSAEFNQIMSEMTYKILDNAFAGRDLTSVTEDEIEAILRENGVVNASAVAKEYKARATLQAKLAEADYSNGIDAVVSALGSECKALGLTEQEVKDLATMYASAQQAMLDAVETGASARLDILKSELEGITGIAEAYALLGRGYDVDGDGVNDYSAEEMDDMSAEDLKKYRADSVKIIAYGNAVEALKKIQDIDIDIGVPNYSGNTKNSSKDNTPDYEDPTDAIINRINLRSKELEQQEESIQNAIKLAESQNDYNKQLSLTNDLITTRKNRVEELNKANAGLHNEAEWLRNSNPWKEEEWFDSQGNATEAYYKLFNSASKEEQEQIKELFDALSKYKKAYMSNAEEITNLNKQILQDEQEIIDLRFNNSKNWISDRNHYNDWELFNDSEVDAWERVVKWLKDDYPNAIDEIKEAEENLFDARKDAMEKSLDDIEDYIDARNHYDDWDAFNDSELKAIQRQTKIIEDAYEQRLLSTEEYVDRLEEYSQRIYSLAQEEIDKSLSNIDKYIDARNHYDDWDAFGDSEIDAVKRQCEILNKAYEENLMSLDDYTEKSEEYAQKLYSIGQEYIDKSLSDIDRYIDARNTYNDWDNWGDSEIEAIKRQIDVVDRAYAEKLMSLEDYTQKTEEYSKKLYSVSKDNIIQTISEMIDDYEKMRQDEKDALSFESTQYSSLKTLLQSHYDVVNAIAEAQHEINKELKASKTMYEYLNEETRKLLFNQDDYDVLSEKLLDIQAEANALQEQYNKDILGATEETIAQITSQYQMQYETMMKQYEIAKAELDVAKKRQKLDNVLAERNVRMFINGQWQWVANTQNVIDAQNELEEAKIKQEQQETSLKQIDSINKLTEAQDDITTQINYLETDLERVRDKWSEMQKMLNGESEEVAEALRQISEVSSPELQRVIEATGGDIISFSESLFESIDTMSTVINTNLNSATSDILDNVVDNVDNIISTVSSGISEIHDKISTGIDSVVTDLTKYSDVIKALAEKINNIKIDKDDEDEDDKMSVSDVIAKMKENSAKWHTASETEKKKLEAENQKLGASIGATYNSASGEWIYPEVKSSSSSGSSSNGDWNSGYTYPSSSSSSSSSSGSSTSKKVNTTDEYVKSSNGVVQSNPNWDGKNKGGVGSFYKHADGTRYTPGGKTLLGEEGFETYIDNNGHLIPINQPTFGNIGAGGIVFNQAQMDFARKIWDWSNMYGATPHISSLTKDKQNTIIDNSIHINGLTVGEQGNEDWINGLRRYVATHK